MPGGPHCKLLKTNNLSYLRKTILNNFILFVGNQVYFSIFVYEHTKTIR